MKCYENAQVARWAYGQLHKALEARGGDRTGTLHASEVLQCARRTVLNRTAPPPPPSADSELAWGVGYALQEFILGPEEEGKEAFGVILSTDRMVKGQVLEFKTTKMSYEALPKGADGKGIRGAEKVRFNPQENQYAQEWLVRSAAYCAANNVTKAHIIVVFLYQNLMSAWTLEFTPKELAASRANIEERRDIIQGHLDAGTLPPVSYRRGAWECANCVFRASKCLEALRDAGLLESDG